jgi:hypothetical protein
MRKSVNRETALHGEGRQGLCGLASHHPKCARKALGFLLDNRGHPSLRAKKYSEALDVWPARVTRDWRFTSRSRAMNISFSQSFPIPNKDTARLHQRAAQVVTQHRE